MRVPVIRNITVKTANQSTAWVLDKEQTNAHVFFFYIESVCNAWFTFEILVSIRAIRLRPNAETYHSSCMLRTIIIILIAQL